jgi:hypothetical protein
MSESLNHISIALPDQKNYEIAYGLAYKIASEKLSNIEDMEEQCRKSDSVCRATAATRIVILKYLNRTYQVALPGIDIRLQNSDEPVELRDKLLILHYLTLARGTPLSNQLIAYQELREGATYYPTFVKRAVKPLIDYFGQTPEKLVDLSRDLGGFKTAYGDTAVTIPAFSRVPITLVLWRGDEEFPPNANILFDNTILDYVSAEDINVLCQTIVWHLVKSFQAYP